MKNGPQKVKKESKKASLTASQWLEIGFLIFLLIILPLVVWGLMTGRFELRMRAVSPSCDLNDLGVISVTDYSRGDGSLGLRAIVTSGTGYDDVALKIVSENKGDWFIQEPPLVVSADDGAYHWLWEIAKPETDDFKIEFYVGHTSQNEGSLCGEEWLKGS